MLNYLNFKLQHACGRREISTTFWLESLRGKDQMEDLDIDGWGDNTKRHLRDTDKGTGLYSSGSE
jgi:hypothetical protein